ncbi:adenylyltransferase and sulfurtransferase, partial [Tanacetum coccineum]
KLGMVDHDVVELNNLHRQIIHGEAYIGRSKVESAAAACRSINSTIEVVEHREALRTSNAMEIVSKYDIVIDATDNAPSRYLISDCCVLLGKPLVSGAALGLEGQLAVYNYKGGPCYRCLFPTPPPTTACQRCSDSGVLGVVPGVIGCLQALEAIKVASLVGEPLSERMLLFDALSARIRIVKIRGRSSQCEACGENATLTQDNFKQFDYENFTQSPLSAAPLKLKLLTPDSRISSKEYNEVVKQGEPHVLIDVRPSHHYKIVSLPKSMNVPLASLEGRLPEISSALNSVKESVRDGSDARLYVVCRRGNDSQRAVDLLHKAGFTSAKDIVGGLESWAHDVDQRFPTYYVVKSEKSERLSEEAKRSALKHFDSKEARLGLTTIQASASGVNEPRHYTRRNASAFTGRTSTSRTLYDESNQDLVDEDDIVDLGNDDDYSD